MRREKRWIMKSKLLLLILFAFLAMATLFYTNKSAKLTSPVTSPVASPSPSPAPTVFKFDSSTDLKKELDNINPQVLDSDFAGELNE